MANTVTKGFCEIFARVSYLSKKDSHDFDNDSQMLRLNAQKSFSKSCLKFCFTSQTIKT